MTNNDFNSVPTPHDDDAERALLASILIINNRVDQAKSIEIVSAIVTSEDFYNSEYGIIYDTILTLNGAQIKPDPMTVIDKVRGSEPFNTMTTEDIHGLFHKIITDHADFYLTENLKRQAQIVAAQSQARRLISAASDITAAAYNSSADTIADVISNAENAIYSISTRRTERRTTSISQAILDYRALLASADTNDLKGVSTGFERLDKVISGFRSSYLVYVGAHTGVGKTAFALNLALNISKQTPDKAIYYFSLEMDTEQITERILSITGQINSKRIREKTADADEMESMARAEDLLISADNIRIDDTAIVTPQYIRSTLRREKLPIGLVVVDYIGLMYSDNARMNDNDYTKISDISRNLKAIAKDFKVPVIALAQLKRNDAPPTLSDLKSSGQTENDADIVLLLDRPAARSADPESLTEYDKRLARLTVAKSRHTAANKAIDMTYISRYLKFIDNEPLKG